MAEKGSHTWAGDDDRRLLERAKAGDSASFGSLVERYADDFLRLVYPLVGDRTAAEDVVQETFMAAYSGMRSFRGDSSVKTWLISILVRQAARHTRRERLRRHSHLDADALRHIRGADSGADARMDLAWALSGLEEPYREVIVLRELEGLSYDEIARVLSVPRGTVESRLHRARKALGALLADYRQ